MVFDDVEIKSYYLEYDVTNRYEAVGMALLIFLNIILLIRLLFNFRAIIRWYLQNEEVDPKKLFCINSVLLISVIIRLISENYSLWGCILSGFFYFEDNRYAPGKEYIYNNIVVYSILEQLYVQVKKFVIQKFQNLAMLIASKFWLYVIQAKYLYAAQSSTDMQEQHLINNSISSSGKQPNQLQSTLSNSSTCFSLSTSLQLLKICSHALRASWIIVVLVTIISSFTYMMNAGANATQISSSIVILTTILSGVSFSLSCLIIYFDLEAFYTVDPKYKRRMRKAALFLVFTQIIRFTFNSLRLFAQQSLMNIKSGTEEISIPDKAIYWAIIVPSYSFVVDFIPTFFLSELFSPLPTIQISVYPKVPDDGWDVKSIS